MVTHAVLCDTFILKLILCFEKEEQILVTRFHKIVLMIKKKHKNILLKSKTTNIYEFLQNY